MTKEAKATPENYLELMNALSAGEVLHLARAVLARLLELKLVDDAYWLEKPHKFPHYWIPALNGTLEDSYLDPEEE